jgi:hypothetical protein
MSIYTRSLLFLLTLVAASVVSIEAGQAFRQKLPRTEKEFRTIASNVAPYMKGK